MDAFDELEHLIDTLDPTGDAAMQRARRLVARVVAAAQPNPELGRALWAFENAFDCLATIHEFDSDWDGLPYLRAGARQRLRELRGANYRFRPKLSRGC